MIVGRCEMIVFCQSIFNFQHEISMVADSSAYFFLMCVDQIDALAEKIVFYNGQRILSQGVCYELEGA